MAGIMSKLKARNNQRGPLPPPPLEGNPIMELFELGDEVGSAGPEHVWRIFDGFKRTDAKEVSLFVFDKRQMEKLYKHKKKEHLVEMLRNCIKSLEKVRHHRMLQILHTLEEGPYTLAFASEPVVGSLANILSWHASLEPQPGDDPLVYPRPPCLGPAPRSSKAHKDKEREKEKDKDKDDKPRPGREYFFIDLEVRYGIMQIVEALHYMHYTAHQVHRNVCPGVILVCKRGTWKLFGLEFFANTINDDPTSFIHVQPWTTKNYKIAQPSLDFTAPEVQATGKCNMLSDMFSLGLVICQVFNGGIQLVKACNNPHLYMKQIQNLDQMLLELNQRVPIPLQEALQRLLCLDPNPRPTTQLLQLISYFRTTKPEEGDVGLPALLAHRGSIEIAIAALQYLDGISMKAPEHKAEFYRTTLIEALAYIPKKLRWQNIWPALQAEIRLSDVIPAVLVPVFTMSREADPEDFAEYVLPSVKVLLAAPRSIQATVTVLENMPTIMEKSFPNDIRCDLLPLLYISCESTIQPIQAAALIALRNVSEYINDDCLAVIVLPKIQIVAEKNAADIKVISLILAFYETILGRIDRTQVIETILPTLMNMSINDPTVVTRVAKLYKTMLLEQRFGLTTNFMASDLIPKLAPQTMNPRLNMDQFEFLIELMYDMLENIDKTQRHRIKLEILQQSSPERKRRLCHQMSSENMNAPPFNIPNLRVDRRKTSSAEDMARRNSATTTPGPSPAPSSTGGGFKRLTGSANIIGQWFFGSNTSNHQSDNNFLRVSSILPNRRLSDNTLMTPKIKIAPSCSSSPGGTPGGSAGLPARRHSSIGPQERRGSAVNLSPPTANRTPRGRGGSGSSLSVPSTSQTAGGSMPNTSSSVPFLPATSMHSVRSRRTSIVTGAGGPGPSLPGSSGAGPSNAGPSGAGPSGAGPSGSGPSGAIPTVAVPGTSTGGVAPGAAQGSQGFLSQIQTGMVRTLNLPENAPAWASLHSATVSGYNALVRQTALAAKKYPQMDLSFYR